MHELVALVVRTAAGKARDQDLRDVQAVRDATANNSPAAQGIIEKTSPAAPRLLASRPQCCILALSTIADDPRVRRQAEAFHRAGWKVITVGIPGANASPPEWPILTRDNAPLGARSLRPLRLRAGQALRQLVPMPILNLASDGLRIDYRPSCCQKRRQ